MKTIIKAILRYILFWVMYLVGIYVFKIRNKVKIIGKNNLPHKSRILYLSNHQTLIDSLLIGMNVINFRELLFYQKNIPWNAPDRKNFLSKKLAKTFFSLLKNIPTDRNQKSIADIEKQINSYCRILQDNNLLLFFEGTRTRNGRIGRCRKGVALTIIKAKPDYIIPITLIGISQIMPVDVGFNYRRIKSGYRGQIIIGEPISFDYNLVSDKLICEKIREVVTKNYPQPKED